MSQTCMAVKCPEQILPGKDGLRRPVSVAGTSKIGQAREGAAFPLHRRPASLFSPVTRLRRHPGHPLFKLSALSAWRS